MAKLSNGTDFSVAGTYSGTDLNNLVDAATVLPGFITEWGAVTPDVADSILLYDASGATLAKCTIQNIIDTIPSGAAAGTASLRALGTSSTTAAAGNDTRFPASVSGIRKSSGAGSTDTAATPNNFAFAPSNLSGLTNIDWSLADFFYDTGLSGNKVYTFSNQTAGRVVTLFIHQNGRTVSFAEDWTMIGTANTAGWNIYSLMPFTGGALITVIN